MALDELADPKKHEPALGRHRKSLTSADITLCRPHKPEVKPNLLGQMGSGTRKSRCACVCLAPSYA